jgi:hypothetical protein
MIKNTPRECIFEIRIFCTGLPFQASPMKSTNALEAPRALYIPARF